jgi:hypothetical protein
MKMVSRIENLDFKDALNNKERSLDNLKGFIEGDSQVDEDEMKCYSRIINSFLNNKYDAKKRELAKNQSILKLIKTSKCKNNKNFVKNALILVLSLYNEEEPADLYCSYGNDIDSCSDLEKEVLKSQLKLELI